MVRGLRTASFGSLVLALAAVGVGRVVIIPAERCSPVSTAAIDVTAKSAVGWFDRAQTPLGTWLYRYDADGGVDLGGYNWVRHAGVMLSLEQAASAGIVGAAAIADAAQTSIRQRLVVANLGLGLDDGGGVLSTGGTALLGLALAQRELRTGDARDSAMLADLGRFVTAQVQPDGSVLEAWARGAPIAGSTSPFTTGEVLFFLARLQRLQPDQATEPLIRRITSYLANRRAAAEGFVPDASDHWAAYALAEMGNWTEAGGALNRDELRFARRQMGIIGIQIRWESQRTNRAPNRWVRGSRTSGASLGTLGEAAAAWTRVATREPALSGQLHGLTNQIECAAAMLVDRQVSDTEARAFAEPTKVAGAYLRLGITQMDDQQHSLSALLAARDLSSTPGLAASHRRATVPSTAALAALVMVVAINPFVARRVRRRDRSARLSWHHAAFTIVAGAAIGAVVGVGGPIVRAFDVSAPTAAVAAGIVVAVAGAVSMLTPDSKDSSSLWRAANLARPAVLIAGVALGAGGQGWSAAIAAFVTLGVSTLLTAVLDKPGPSGGWFAYGPSMRFVAPTVDPTPTESYDATAGAWNAIRRVLVRASDAVAVLAGVSLIVQGVFAV
jgi:hypothetical protein